MTKWSIQTAKQRFKDIFLLVLGMYGNGFFSWVKDTINMWNPNIFVFICVILSYIVLEVLIGPKS